MTKVTPEYSFTVKDNQGFQNSFHIPTTSVNNQNLEPSYNHHSDHTKDLADHICEELSHGRISGPYSSIPMKDFCTSAFGDVSKNEGWKKHLLPIAKQISCSLQWILQNEYQVKTVSHILDDFIFIARNKYTHQKIWMLSWTSRGISISPFNILKQYSLWSLETTVVIHQAVIPTALVKLQEEMTDLSHGTKSNISLRADFYTTIQQDGEPTSVFISD